MKYVDTWMKSIWILGDRKNLEKPWYRNVQYDVTSTTMINHVSPVIFQYPIIFGYRKTAICGRDRRNSGTIASFASSSQPGLTWTSRLPRCGFPRGAEKNSMENPWTIENPVISRSGNKRWESESLYIYSRWGRSLTLSRLSQSTTDKPVMRAHSQGCYRRRSFFFRFHDALWIDSRIGLHGESLDKPSPNFTSPKWPQPTSDCRSVQDPDGATSFSMDVIDIDILQISLVTWGDSWHDGTVSSVTSGRSFRLLAPCPAREWVWLRWQSLQIKKARIQRSSNFWRAIWRHGEPCRVGQI